MAVGTRHADEGQDQPLSEARVANRQKFDDCQHAMNRLWSDGCVATNGNAEDCCWAADKHLSTSQ